MVTAIKRVSNINYTTCHSGRDKAIDNVTVGREIGVTEYSSLEIVARLYSILDLKADYVGSNVDCFLRLALGHKNR